ncbi:Uncharacterised protein [Mycobacteroides abscessus]|nr:Uncharacterised protein [Mycobacteroides abscessus]
MRCDCVSTRARSSRSRVRWSPRRLPSLTRTVTPRSSLIAWSPRDPHALTASSNSSSCA